MLTNLGPLSLERIHTMLQTFGIQGNVRVGISDLKRFLEEKVTKQELIYVNELYSLDH